MSEKRQKDYIAQTYGSAARFEYVAGSVNFPQDVRGKVILDLGSSVSNAVIELNKRGARAYGVDFRYTGLADLIPSVENSFTDPKRWHFPIARHIDPDLRGETSPDFIKPSGNLLVRLLDGFREHWQDNLRWMGSAAYLRNSERVYKEFLKDFHSEQRKGKYVAARFENLPFADDSADLIYSVAALSIFVIRDEKAFTKSMSEVLRVGKSGSTVVIDPWYDEPNSVWSLREVQNAKRFIRSLRGQP